MAASDLRFTVRTAGGRAVTLGPPLSLEILSTLDSPANSFSAVFPLQNTGDWAQPFLTVEVLQGARTVFAGGVDEQKESLSAGGHTASLSARSRGALPLDNEALPQRYQNPRLSDIFRNHMAPYGFTGLTGGHAGAALSFFSVRKDLSEWEVLEAFCRRAVALRPFVLGDTVVVGRPEEHLVGRHLLTNEAQGVGHLRYLSLERVRRRSEPIASVMVRHPIGLYLTQYKNPDCGPLEIRRKRYVIPSTEYADFAATRALDASLRMKRSMAGYESWKARLPGIAPVKVHDIVTLMTPLMPPAERVVGAVRHLMGPGGAETRLLLLDGKYVY